MSLGLSPLGLSPLAVYTNAAQAPATDTTLVSWSEDSDVLAVQVSELITSSMEWVEAADGEASAATVTDNVGSTWQESTDTFAASAQESYSSSVAWTEANDNVSIANAQVASVSVAWIEDSDTSSLNSRVATIGQSAWSDSADQINLQSVVRTDSILSWQDASDTFSEALSVVDVCSIVWAEGADAFSAHATDSTQGGVPTFTLSSARTISVHPEHPFFVGGSFWDFSDPNKPTCTKMASATVDFTFDWNSWLVDIESSAISDVVFTAIGVDSIADFSDGVKTTVFVSGGVSGGTASVACKVTIPSTPPRVEQKTIYLNIPNE